MRILIISSKELTILNMRSAKAQTEMSSQSLPFRIVKVLIYIQASLQGIPSALY